MSRAARRRSSAPSAQNRGRTRPLRRRRRRARSASPPRTRRRSDRARRIRRAGREPPRRLQGIGSRRGAGAGSCRRGALPLIDALPNAALRDARLARQAGSRSDSRPPAGRRDRLASFASPKPPAGMPAWRRLGSQPGALLRVNPRRHTCRDLLAQPPTRASRQRDGRTLIPTKSVGNRKSDGCTRESCRRCQTPVGSRRWTSEYARRKTRSADEMLDNAVLPVLAVRKDLPRAGPAERKICRENDRPGQGPALARTCLGKGPPEME